jgi:hypothetical protein
MMQCWVHGMNLKQLNANLGPHLLKEAIDLIKRGECLNLTMFPNERRV